MTCKNEHFVFKIEAMVVRHAKPSYVTVQMAEVAVPNILEAHPFVVDQSRRDSRRNCLLALNIITAVAARIGATVPVAIRFFSWSPKR